MSQGITLLELLVSVAIIGTVAAFTVPSFESFINRSEIKNKSNELFEYIRLAKLEAVKRNKTVEVFFDTSSQNYYCLGMRDQGANDTCSTASSSYPRLRIDKNRYYELKTVNANDMLIDIVSGGLFSFNPHTGKSSTSKRILLRSQIDASLIAGVRITDIGFVYSCSDQGWDGELVCV